jgi:hypothetical protein
MLAGLREHHLRDSTRPIIFPANDRLDGTRICLSRILFLSLSICIVLLACDVIGKYWFSENGSFERGTECVLNITYVETGIQWLFSI